MWNWLKNLFLGAPKAPVILHETIQDKILSTARGELGVKELRGGENPRIIEYHAATSLGAKEDEIPWCASFVCWVLSQCGVKSTRSAAAISYRDWGIKIPSISYAIPGDIIVRARPGGNHVHILNYPYEKGSVNYKAIGGNQSDAVTIEISSVAGIIAIRRIP